MTKLNANKILFHLKTTKFWSNENMCFYSMLIIVPYLFWHGSDIKVGEGHSYNKIENFKKYVKTSCNKITKNLVGCKK